MKSILINLLVICISAIVNKQLQSMDKTTVKSIDLSDIWDQARLDTVNENDLNRSLLETLDNTSMHSIENLDFLKKSGASFDIVLDNGKTLLHRYATIPQTVAWLLENTNIDCNKQDDQGNTVAHYFAGNCPSNRALLVKAFNALIKKNSNPLIKNNENKTAKDIAIDANRTCSNSNYSNCANLFNQLEQIFDPKTLCFFAKAVFVLKDDGDTIEVIRD